MNDPVWCQKLLEQFAELVKTWTWTEERFSGSVRDASVTWQDSAAREIYLRHMEPYIDQAIFGRERLQEQIERLNHVVLQMVEAEVPSRLIGQLSEEIDALSREVESNVGMAHHHVDEALDFVDRAAELRSKAKSILNSI